LGPDIFQEQIYSKIVQKPLLLEDSYYKCRDANYLVKDYLYWMDVRLLTVKQWEKLIKDLLALKNVVFKEENPSVEEDFV